MKVLLSWLNDYVDLSDLTPEQVSERLTFSGIEVEGVTPVGHDYEGLLVGEVRSVRPHPNADRLRLCTVFDGQVEHEVYLGPGRGPVEARPSSLRSRAQQALDHESLPAWTGHRMAEHGLAVVEAEQ